MISRSGRDEVMRLEVPLGLFGAALIALAFIFAAAGIPDWIPPAATTAAGVPSPLSGMTRSFVALASGDPATAFRWHPLGPLAFASCAIAFVGGLASWSRGRRLAWPAVVSSRRFWWSVVALFVVTWIRQIIWLGGDRGLL